MLTQPQITDQDFAGWCLSLREGGPGTVKRLSTVVRRSWRSGQVFEAETFAALVAVDFAAAGDVGAYLLRLGCPRAELLAAVTRGLADEPR